MTHVALAGLYDPQNVEVWSGIPFYVLKHLQARSDINIENLAPATRGIPSAAAIKAEFYKRRGLKYLWSRDLAWARYGAAIKGNALKKSRASDVLVFNPSDAAFLDTDKRISIIIDATWRQFCTAYEPHEERPFCQETIEHASISEHLGFGKAHSIVCMTPWAAEGVVRHYPRFASKVIVALPGANLNEIPTSHHVEAMIETRARDLSGRTRKVLFVGASPSRKGLDTAIEACAALRSANHDLILNAVGFHSRATPSLPSYVKTFGFMSKSDVFAQQTFQRLLSTADIFLFPTRAECAGLVLCEAAAYGLPVVTSGAGGSKFIVENESGILVGPDADANAYAREIDKLFDEPSRYRTLSRKARLRFERWLNWNTFTEQLFPPCSM